MKQTTEPATRLSRRLRVQRRIERWLESLEGPDAAATAEVVVASENQRLAFVGIVVALVGMTAALVIAYTVGGVKVARTASPHRQSLLQYHRLPASMFVPVPGAAAGITLGLLLSPIPYVPLPQPIVVGVIVAAGSAIGELTGYSTGVGGRAVIGRGVTAAYRVRATLDAAGRDADRLGGIRPEPVYRRGRDRGRRSRDDERRFVGVMFIGKCVNHDQVVGAS